MNEFSPESPHHVFKAYANSLKDGRFPSHVSHVIQGESAGAERIDEAGIVGTEREFLDEAHAFIAKYVADHSEGRG